MTLAELQAKREEVLQSLGIARITFGERSIEYARQADALAAIDREIARLAQPEQTRVFTIQSKRGLQ
jgi:high-affinity nickel permease